MKRNIIYTSLLALAALSMWGCKKFLNINTDPNHPLSVSESLILSPVEMNTSTDIVGGFNGETAAYWMQQLSINQPSPDIESYLIQPQDVDNTWSSFEYPNNFENLKTMIGEAEAAGHNQYAAIGKALFAYNLAIVTDVWGDVPYSQALQIPAILKPVYDPQEAIYGDIQNLLDSALYYIAQPASVIAPGTDDFIYGGNMTEWSKFIYMLKARFYLRLTKAPGRTASTQADSALAVLANAFGSNSDNATVYYTGSATGQNPWYENTLPGAGGVVMAASFIDSLISRNDPRLTILADTGDAGTYVGRPSGAVTAADPNYFSTVNTFYGGYLPLNVNNSAGGSASLYLATYTEQLFIQAEATFLTSGAAAAQPIYLAAIQAHMDMLGVPSVAEAAYLSSRPALTSGNALQQIINEKYVADFLSIETYNDWRRTGYPTLALAQNAYTPYIPRHWPYGTTELLANPQPQDTVTTAARVWWDAAN
jgi:Starch-binding associating with outer membrane